ncbi:hypothetical protein EVAR_16507_1 [Eumeta japonica]|uniref:Uncharacterized protein n=1 Tax=Eumeta variegata TaxID=151549 RepID=A0A4C1U2Q1_EUMVA|nr:hypothetical protein EVAR_16507_1 [Eumeta japonica]
MLRETFSTRSSRNPIFSKLAHSAHVSEIGLESVEEVDSQTLDRLAVVYSHIYIDGSLIEGKVGAVHEMARREGDLRAALTKKTVADYDGFPLSYVKKVISTTSLEQWQEWVLRQIGMTSQIVQTLTGHGRFAHYLYRLKLRDSPYCACDPAKDQDMRHVLEKYFLREFAELEGEIDATVGR